MTILINANIFPMTKMYNAKNPMLENGYVFIEGTAIKDIGYMKDFIAPNDECSKIIDLNGALITPGFVDAHSHIGIWEDGLNFEGADGNEETDPCTPHLKALDAINPLDPTFKEALLAGITSVVVGPGSANPIGGQILAMKTAGTRIDNMLIKEPLAIKMAFGENPKTVYNDKNQSPSTRMATAAIIREALEKAKEHLEQINSYLENTDENIRPDLDVKSEALIPLLEHEIPIHAHVHRADDIFTAIRIAKEFELDLVLVHCTEGHLVANELSKEIYPVLAGPIMTDRSKPELKNQSSESPKILNDFGIKTAIITDHPETPEKLLPLCAALAVRDGLNFYDALRAITIVPAEVCGISDRVGSLEVGKDADIVVWKTSPLDIMEKPLQVFCNGELFQN